MRTGLLCALTLAVVAAAATTAPQVEAQGDAALTGVVRSAREGTMEGVLVTARRAGANFDVSVVSDASGAYRFPRTHLKPGEYTLKIRAVGYDLTALAVASVVGGSAARLDLTLRAADDTSRQVNNVEWLMSLPGTESQKAMVQRQILSCTYCHSLARIVKSRHTAEQWVPVITRMQKYYNDGTANGEEGRGRAVLFANATQVAMEKQASWGYHPGVKKSDLGAYLATINMSPGGSGVPKTFTTMPRPKGRETRVIVTQYDMPRKDTVPHDMDVDAAGTPWYTDQSRPFLGKMDPRTAAFTEYPLPPATTHPFTGASDVRVDRNGHVWTPVTSDKVKNHFGWPIRFDPKTGEIARADMPAGALTQFLAFAPDGKVWSGFNTFFRIDPKTMKVDYTAEWGKAKNLPPGPHTGYEVAVDSKGNPYTCDYSGSLIVGVDIRTGAARFWKTPTPNSQPRRGKIDAQDRYWFGEYTGDRIGMLDLKSEKFQEWPLGAYTAPYTVSVPDSRGHVYAPSNTADRLYRLDPKSGEVLGYLMPTDFDAKTVSIDPISKRAAWMANVRTARLIKVEPID